MPTPGSAGLLKWACGEVFRRSGLHRNYSTCSSSYKPLGYVPSPLGELAVFNISHGEMEAVRSQHGLSVKSATPTEIVRRLLPFILHKRDALKDDGAKPDAPTLSDDEVRALPDEVVEAALELFIEPQEHLYKRLTSEVKTNDKGERVTSLSYTDVKHPKRENETNVQYLHRLLVLDEEELRRQAAKIVGAAHFSASLNESIRNTLQLGDSISKTLDAMRLPKLFDAPDSLPAAKLQDFGKMFEPPLTAVPPIQPVPSIDHAAITSSAEEARWAPVNAVNERLDNLVELTAQSSQFMVQMNETQTRIASEIKASGEEASRTGTTSLEIANASLAIARRGFWLTIVVVLLTVLGLIVAADSWRTSGGNAEREDKRAEEIVRQLGQVRDAVVDSGSSSSRDTMAVLDQLKAALNELNAGRREQASRTDALLNELKSARADQATQFQAALEEQKRVIDLHAQQASADRNTIDALRNRVAELEGHLQRLRPTTAPK